MSDPASSFYASAPVQALFARELAALAPILAGVYGSFGLFVRAHAGAPAHLPPHLVTTMLDLACSGPRFDGAVSCEPDRLPFAGETFKLLIAQHAFERFARPEECVAELARVLAPEGVVLVFGFNPVGFWRPWLALNARGTARLHLKSAYAWQQLLAREQIDTLQVRFPGTLLPRAHGGEHGRSSAFGRFGGSWLVLARKRRSTLTPLRLRSNARDLALSPRLAPGAQRARA
ncbi:MAG TPA: methyltransferase domain-containing protein [Rudaea sp.]|nr:methyltransferase domain-containing protein [Rudaea sp.]